jgi:hypothetical protein
MSSVNINVSGASGSGSSVKIYETPEYNYPWHGACVMHGSFTTGPTSSPDTQRIEIVELCLPVLNIRVRADSVRTELRALLAANKAWEEGSGCPIEHQPARYKAFIKLQAAVFGVPASGITVEHIERIVQAAYAEGLRNGKEALREQFLQLLDL